jgi:hypothetical protein
MWDPVARPNDLTIKKTKMGANVCPRGARKIRI